MLTKVSTAIFQHFVNNAEGYIVKNIKQGKLVNGSIGRVINFMTIRKAQEDGIGISAPFDISPNGTEPEDEEDKNELSPSTQQPQYQFRTQLEQLIFERYKDDPAIANKPTKFLNLTGNSYPLDQDYPLVKFTNDMELLCVPMFFERIGIMGNIEACRIQVPLILSWAITIHKSQGQTLDFVKVDFDRIFADGQGKMMSCSESLSREAYPGSQAYVAVSRATSMEGLQIVNFDPKK
jgi:ATP-dependent DNA helicase PIF1